MNRENSKRGFIYVWTLPALSVLVLVLFLLFPHFMDSVYSSFIYRYVAQLFSIVWSVLPFSVAEALVLVAVYLIVVAIINIRRGKMFWKRVGINTIYVVLNILAIFILNCGVNYHRVTLKEKLGLNVKERNVQELVNVAQTLARKTNYASAFVNRTDSGRFFSQKSFKDTRIAVDESYNRMAEILPFVRGHFPAVKPVITSKLMSYSFITGFFFPWTIEANINNSVPDFWRGSLIAHEDAHVRGIMREEEANYLMFLVARYTTDEEVRYSCLLHSFIEVYNALYKAAPEVAKQLQVCPIVLIDLRENSHYWQKFRSPMADVATKFNNAYLKANLQKDGVESYGKVVDLILADYEANENWWNE